MTKPGETLRRDSVTSEDGGTFLVQGAGWYWSRHRADGSVVDYEPRMRAQWDARKKKHVQRPSARTFLDQARRTVVRHVAEAEE